MRITRDIQSLSDFKQNASKFVKQVQETREPIVLTVNGKPAVVLRDADSYQALVDRDERVKEIELVRQRLASLKAGSKRIPADEVFRKISLKYGITFEEEVDA
jgi:prevent-host-death family protein